MRAAHQIFAFASIWATAIAAGMFETLLPTASPTITSEPRRCTTEILEKYFDVPKPTGELLSALLSYGDELINNCAPTSTLTNAMGIPTCPFPAQSEWCAFTTAAPQAILPDYSSYASTASSWWAAQSSAANEYARACPISWFKAMMAMPGGAGWLNNTIAFAGCYAKGYPSGDGSMATGTTDSMDVPGETVAGAVYATTTELSSGVGRIEEVELWMMAGTGLAAAAANTLL